MSHTFLVIFFIFFLFFSFSCGYNTTDKKIEYKEKKISKFQTGGVFESYFSQPDSFFISSNDTSHKLFSVSPRNGLLECNSGEMIAYDYAQKQFFLISNRGVIEKKIGGRGQGPGEYLAIVSYCLDELDNLYAFDVSANKILIFSPPDYSLKNTLFLYKTHLKSMKASKGFIYGLDTYASDIINIIDSTGKLQKSFHRFEDEKLRLFTSRFLNGGIALFDNAIWLIYIERYSIYNYNYDGLLNKEVHFLPGQFTPTPPKFPSNLNPYDISHPHWDYWNSFLHVVMVHNINNQYLLCLLEQSLQIQPLKHYLNIHDFNGNMIAEGIEIPNNQLLCGASNKFIYCKSRESDEASPNKIKIFKYKVSIMP